jgi:protein-tyrosine phosphatase
LIDLHSHLLPGIDDGAPDLGVALAMARAMVADGVRCVACTPHILPGLYHNTGPDIRARVDALQAALDAEGIPLELVAGADNHVVPTFLRDLHSGHLLPLGASRYVLVEPPHHVMPPQLELVFSNLLGAGYVPILTHPERLSWINQQYAVIERLAGNGVWMQITAGSLIGTFGRGPRHWAERMLDDGLAHILATDAHDLVRRPPCLSAGWHAAAARVGAEEAWNLVETRPLGILHDTPANRLPPPIGLPMSGARLATTRRHNDSSIHRSPPHRGTSRCDASGSFAGRLQRLFG